MIGSAFTVVVLIAIFGGAYLAFNPPEDGILNTVINMIPDSIYNIIPGTFSELEQDLENFSAGNRIDVNNNLLYGIEMDPELLPPQMQTKSMRKRIDVTDRTNYRANRNLSYYDIPAMYPLPAGVQRIR